jgi:cytochrome c-type biogenesis protein CcmH
MFFLIAAITTVAAAFLSRQRPWRVRGLVVCTLGVAVALYCRVGSPTQPDSPYRQEASALLQKQELERAALAITQQLQRNPSDRERWQQAGRIQAALQQYDKAQAAFRAALLLSPDDTETQVSLAETLVLQAKGTVPPEARSLFTSVLKKQRQQPAALYYQGLALFQQGRLQEALSTWKTLRQYADPQAPWYPGFTRAFQALEKRVDQKP